MGRENIFKKIGLPFQQVPAEVKCNILSNIERVKVLKELTNLFTSEFKLIFSQAFKKK